MLLLSVIFIIYPLLCSTQSINNSIILTLNPAKDNLAPCTCDVTPQICDINCCCDKDCTQSDLAVFSYCLPQAQHQIDPLVDYYNCSNINAYKENWFPILCIHSSTSVLLGKYFLPSSQPILQTTSDFDTKFKNQAMKEYNSRSQYLDDTFSTSTRFETTQRSTCFNNFQTYKNGSCILTNSNNVLIFPRPILSRRCSYSSPVKYLFNLDTHFCDIDLDSASCTTNTQLNPSSYNNPGILDKFGGSIVSPQLEMYSCGVTNKFSDNSKLNADLINQTPVNAADNCQLSNKTFIFDRLSTNACSTQPPNSQTYPVVRDSYSSEDFTTCTRITTSSSPSLSGQTCTGVVTRVKYVLFWKNSTITKVLIRLVTNDLPINSKISQKFELVWHPDDDTATQSAQTVTQYENILASQSQRELSGPNGYLFNKPIISGRLINNVVDTSLDNSMGSYLTNSDNLCGINSLKRKILFGLNLTSSCQIRVDINDFNKCSNLRKLIFNRLNAYYVPSDYVAKSGNITYTQLDSQWLKVYQQENIINNWIYASLNEDTNKTNQICTQIPSGLTVWFLYAKVGLINNEPINEILSTYVTYSKSTWQFKCKKDLNNDCSTNEFKIDFNTKFIDITKGDLNSSTLGCNNNTESCINDILWIWTNNYEGESVLYLWTVNLSLVFGICCILIVHVIFFGLTCPC